MPSRHSDPGHCPVAIRVFKLYIADGKIVSFCDMYFLSVVVEVAYLTGLDDSQKPGSEYRRLTDTRMQANRIPNEGLSRKLTRL